MSRKLRDDCFPHDQDRLTHAQALAILRERAAPVMGVEEVALASAAGRYLARALTAPRPIPAHTNAAVDGYAFAFADYDPKAGATLPVKGRVAAGKTAALDLPKGCAVQIFTGAALPQGLDTVVMQEDTQTGTSGGEPCVRVPAGLSQGVNRRLEGEDVGRGDELLEAGRRLRPQDVATAASAGFDRLACFEPLKAAVLSSGNEIVRAGEPLAPGQVYDANAPMLRGLIEAAGVVCDDLGVLGDERGEVEAELERAARAYHVVITTGGASRGEEDHIVEAMARLGQLHMWQIAVKPGRPMAFGRIGDGLVMGLPGNPVAVFVCFLLYVRPVLVRLAGGAWREPVRYPLPAAFAVPEKKTGRREFWRGYLTNDAEGGIAVGKFERDGSGLISSLRAADGLIEIGEETASVAEGDRVQFIPFSQFGIASA